MVASHYAHGYCEAVGTVRILCACKTSPHTWCPPGDSKAISNRLGPNECEGVVPTYLVGHASDNLQSEGEAKDKIVGGTIQQ